mgnify:CR=1 FL=1
MGVRAIVDALALGSRNMITTGLLLVAVGLVVNVIAMTGVGNTLSLMIQQWAGGSLVVALVLIALIYVAAGAGQKLGSEQVDVLQGFLERAIGTEGSPGAPVPGPA